MENARESCLKLRIYKRLITLYVNEILHLTIPIKATEQHFAVALFIMLHKVVLTFEPLNENRGSNQV